MDKSMNKQVNESQNEYTNKMWIIMFCVLNKYTSVLRRFSSEILAQYILEMRRGQRLLSVTSSGLRMFHFTPLCTF